MKTRFSKEKSEWSSHREEEYRKKCESILFNSDSFLTIEEGCVLLNHNDQKIKISDPDQTKHLWYEAWLYLTNNDI